jgi:hypothetical protein
MASCRQPAHISLKNDHSLCSAKRIFIFKWREGQGKAGPMAPTFPEKYPIKGLGEGVRTHRPLALSHTNL